MQPLTTNLSYGQSLYNINTLVVQNNWEPQIKAIAILLIVVCEAYIIISCIIEANVYFFSTNRIGIPIELTSETIMVDKIWAVD